MQIGIVAEGPIRGRRVAVTCLGHPENAGRPERRKGGIRMIVGYRLCTVVGSVRGQRLEGE
jgi:hypothetical protein